MKRTSKKGKRMEFEIHNYSCSVENINNFKMSNEKKEKREEVTNPETRALRSNTTTVIIMIKTCFLCVVT